MATKDYSSLQPSAFGGTSNGQYSNLNLNQNQKYSSDAFLKTSKNVTNEKRKVLDYGLQPPTKLSDFANDNVSQTKKESHSWNKSTTNDFSIANSGFEKEDGLKKEKDLSASTLSLHIQAYENLYEPYLFDGIKEDSMKKWENTKEIFVDSTKVIQNPFEFPRQQRRGRATAPESAQFRASQRLLSPDQMNQTSFQQPFPQSSNGSLASFSSRRSSMPSNRRSRAPSFANNTTIQSIRGGYEVTGEEIQKRLNSAQRKKTVRSTLRTPRFPGYTLTPEELTPYLRAKYMNGAEQFWSITEIIKCSPGNALPFNHIFDIYYFLYNQILDEKTLRGIFNADPSKFARQIFVDENEIFRVSGQNPNFLVSLVNPDANYVPPKIRDEERRLILRKLEMMNLESG